VRKREVGGVRRTVEPLHTHEHIGQRGGQAVDANCAAGQATGVLHTPTLDVGPSGKGATVGGWLGVIGKTHIESQPQVVAARRDFPQHLIGIEASLAQLEIGWAELVRQHPRHQRHEQ
jgi:hypothetical protein